MDNKSDDENVFIVVVYLISLMKEFMDKIIRIIANLTV